MAAKKSSKTTEIVLETKEPDLIGAALEATEARKKAKKEELPKGFTERLEGGVLRKIRVDKSLMYEKGANIFIVSTGGKVERYARVIIEEGCELKHSVEAAGCSLVGAAWVQTRSSLLVG